MIKKISLIIPSKNNEKKLLELLKNLFDWEVIPNEVIVVDSSHKKFFVPEDLKSSFKKLNISLKIIYGESLYPGHARNIGIDNSINSLLAFLDTSTQPNKKWLSSGLHIMNINNSQGIWGNTYYESDTYTSKIIRACTYGKKPIKTFPGSILKKDIFKKNGLFIESTRAGEDGDWMSRLSYHKITLSQPDEFLNYGELKNMSFKKLLKKWFRNYTFSGKLPHRKSQKDLYFYFISIVAILLAYNWNTVIASWDTNSDYFIPNITKISALMILIIYSFIRGIMLPRKKGIDYSFIFPINFLIITLLSFCIDCTKALAFGYSKLKK